MIPAIPEALEIPEILSPQSFLLIREALSSPALPEDQDFLVLLADLEIRELPAIPADQEDQELSSEPQRLREGRTRWRMRTR